MTVNQTYQPTPGLAVSAIRDTVAAEEKFPICHWVMVADEAGQEVYQGVAPVAPQTCLGAPFPQAQP